ncbi:MAG: hypothetical protein NZ528_01835 [Caldilineales bacterium]|nr:hypothetical protein [Caldilineales bacterium]MDW8318793.1 hypothetical protein [Anaerolineae bacterium]
MADFQSTPAILSERVLLLEACPLHYWVGGAIGRPLIAFLHGATVDYRMFDAHVEALAPHYRANQHNPAFTNRAILAFLGGIGL